MTRTLSELPPHTRPAAVLPLTHSSSPFQKQSHTWRIGLTRSCSPLARRHCAFLFSKSHKRQNIAALLAFAADRCCFEIMAVLHYKCVPRIWRRGLAWLHSELREERLLGPGLNNQFSDSHWHLSTINPHVFRSERNGPRRTLAVRHRH